MRNIRKGDVLTLKKDILGNSEGCEALVFDVRTTETTDLISVIFENGEHDEFTRSEIASGFTRTGHDKTIAGYEFTGAGDLYKDYLDGKFFV